MESKNLYLEQNLINQLEEKGIEQTFISLFVKDLTNSFYIEDISDINNRLHLLGWSEFELDHHTLELAKACFESK